MTISTAILFHVMAKHGVIWNGACSAFVLALMADTFLAALAIYGITQ